MHLPPHLTQCLCIKNIIQFLLLKDLTTWHTRDTQHVHCMFVNVTSNGTYIYSWFRVISWFRSRDTEKKCGVIHVASRSRSYILQ